jgi:hypothetical protein
LLAGTGPVEAPAAVDLTKIDRGIAKEPTYQSKAPKYCLLVFGPEAKTRVWLVLDDKVLYVDRNANGDLTEAGKAVPFSGSWTKLGDITEPDGKTKHTDLRMKREGDGIRLMLLVGEKRRHYVGWDESDPLSFADRREDAPVVHLDGPLTMRLYDVPPTFARGATCEINASVGTPGLGKGSFAAIQCCNILDCKVAPVAEITFPNRKVGKEPILTRTSLSDD